MAGEETNGVGRLIGSSEYDMVIGRLIERTDHMTRLGEKLSNDHRNFTRTVSELNVTLIKMQGVLDGIVKERNEEEWQTASKLTTIDARLAACEKWDNDIKFIRDLRAGWTRVLIWTIIAGGIILLAAVKFGSATKFLE